MNRFRIPALVALWVQVAVTFGLAAYTVVHGNFTGDAFLSGFEALFAGVVLVWWTTIFGRVTLGRGVPSTDGTLRALAVFYPWLTALRLSLWAMLGLGLLAGLADTANPVALTALMTVWGGAIFASNAVSGALVRLVTDPEEMMEANAGRLSDWLNISAALSLGMTVMNVVPVRGLGEAPDLSAQLVYGLGGGLDILATVLALLAVRAGIRRQTAPPNL